MPDGGMADGAPVAPSADAPVTPPQVPSPYAVPPGMGQVDPNQATTKPRQMPGDGGGGNDNGGPPGVDEDQSMPPSQDADQGAPAGPPPGNSTTQAVRNHAAAVLAMMRLARRENPALTQGQAYGLAKSALKIYPINVTGVGERGLDFGNRPNVPDGPFTKTWKNWTPSDGQSAYQPKHQGPNRPSASPDDEQSQSSDPESQPPSSNAPSSNGPEEEVIGEQMPTSSHDDSSVLPEMYGGDHPAIPYRKNKGKPRPRPHLPAAVRNAVDTAHGKDPDSKPTLTLQQMLDEAADSAKEAGYQGLDFGNRGGPPSPSGPSGPDDNKGKMPGLPKMPGGGGGAAEGEAAAGAGEAAGAAAGAGEAAGAAAGAAGAAAGAGEAAAGIAELAPLLLL
jgi:hypothetical protein